MKRYFVVPRLSRWEGAFQVQVPFGTLAPTSIPKEVTDVSPGFLKVFYRLEDLMHEYPQVDLANIIVVAAEDEKEKG